MPTDVTVDTPSGPVVGVAAFARCRRRALRRGAVRARRAVRAARAVVLDANRSTRPTPGAAPPQTVGGLDLVPGWSRRRSRKPASPPRSARRDLDGSRPVLVWVPGGSYRIGAASLPTYDGAHLARTRRGGGRAQLPARRAGLARRRRRSVEPGAARPARRGRRGCAPTSPAFGGDPDRIVLMGESAGSGCIAHLLATRSPSGPSGTPVAGDPAERRARGHARRRGRHLGRRAVPRRRGCDVGRRRCATAPHRRAPGRAGADGRGVAGEGRHDAVPPLGRRRPACTGPRTAPSSRRSRSSSARPRTRWSCSATRCRRCPRTSR